MRIPDINIGGGQLGVRSVVPQTNPLEVVGAGLNIAGQIVEQKEKRDASAFVIGASTDLQLGGLQALEDAKAEAKNPDEISSLFFNKLTAKRQEIEQTAPNDFARQELNERYEQLRASLGGRAIQEQVQQQQAVRVQSVDNALLAKKNFIRNGGAFSDVMPLIERDLQDASTFMDAGKIAELKTKTMQEVKAARIDYMLENEDIKGVSELINDPTFSSDLPTKTIDATRNSIAKIKQDNKKLLETDPAGYVAKQAKMEGIDYSPDAAVKVQKDQGINPLQAQVIPKEEAKQLADRMTKIDNEIEMQSFLGNIKQTYGQYANNAIKDLNQAGLPKGYSYMLHMDEIQDAEELSLMFQATKAKESDFKELTSTNLKLANKKPTDFQTDLSEKINDVMEVMNREGADQVTLNNIYNDTYTLASAHFNKYKDYDKAIAFAKNYLTKDIQILEFGDTMARIPADQDIDQVQTGLEILQKQAEVSITGVRSIFSSLVSNSLTDNARWVANEDGSGMLLLSNNNEPLLDKQGNRIQYTFKDIVKAAKSPPQTVREGIGGVEIIK